MPSKKTRPQPVPPPPKTCGPGVQRVIWAQVYAGVIADRARAPAIIADNDAAGYIREKARGWLRTPIEVEACNRYAYREYRAWVSSRAYGSDYPLDPAARRDWIQAGGRRPNPVLAFERIELHRKAHPDQYPATTPQRRRRG